MAYTQFVRTYLVNNMFKCEICNKPVSDKGFRIFITYEFRTLIKGLKDPLDGQRTVQVRLCGRCLKKKGKNLEIKI